MINRRPANYKEWRSLLHSLNGELGQHVYLAIRRGRSPIDKETYRIVSQIRRVQTRSYCEALMDALFDERS